MELEVEAIRGLTESCQTSQMGLLSPLTSQCPPSSLPKSPTSETHPEDETNRRIGGGHASDSSPHEAKEAASQRRGRPTRRRKRKTRGRPKSMSGFLEALAMQLVEHLEGLQRELREAVEKMEREREEREEAWRREEAEKRESEAAARARDRALASAREAVIISCIEKVTGQRVDIGLGRDTGEPSCDPSVPNLDH